MYAHRGDESRGFSGGGGDFTRSTNPYRKIGIFANLFFNFLEMQERYYFST